MPPHPLTKFNGIYSRNILSKINGETYEINFNEYISIGTHWIASHVNGDSITYLDSFQIKYIPKEIKKFLGKENITKIFT